MDVKRSNLRYVAYCGLYSIFASYTSLLFNKVMLASHFEDQSPFEKKFMKQVYRKGKTNDRRLIKNCLLV